MVAKPLNILIVDDDDVIREQVRRFLSKSTIPFEIEEAASQSQGKSRLLAGGIDCAIIDFHMGDGDAFKMLEDIRDEQPNFHTPLVLLTGVGNEEIAVKAIKLGINDYISKDNLSEQSLVNGIRTAVAEQKLARAEDEHKVALEYLSMHDELTGMPNRRLLMERLEQRILMSERNGEPFALIVIDLDRFKSINDTLGHVVGDEVLKVVGARLLEIARRSDTYARLGGDEFSVLLSSANAVDGAVTVANKIASTIKQPIRIGKDIVHTEASIGIAMYPEHGRAVKSLLAHADEAMYQSKRSINHFTVFQGTNDLPLQESAQISMEIPQLTDTDQFDLHYQPKYNLLTGEIVGFEALARWWHYLLGDVSPAKFIPIIERSKFITTFTNNVLSKAIAQAANWRLIGLDLPISVNISAQALTDENFGSTVRELLEHYQVPAKNLTLEITETTNLHNYDLTAGLLIDLASDGIGISIDDFGTGYTSIRYLRDFPATELKIDRLFVSDLRRGGRDYSIISGIVRLAEGIGAITVAEGIESEQTLNTLVDLGCTYGQGFFLGHPAAPSTFHSTVMSAREDFPRLGHFSQNLRDDLGARELKNVGRRPKQKVRIG